MKKGILINALGDSSWIGGLYYVKNIAFQISLNSKIMEKYNIYIYTTKENESLFRDLPYDINVITIDKPNDSMSKFGKIYTYLQYHIKYVFPSNVNLKWLGITSIAWIPDFQHCHLGELFSEDVKKQRNNLYSSIAQSNSPLILSSKNSLDDFEFFYPNTKNNVMVVPFVSYIEPIIREIDLSEEKKILNRFNLLDKKYACVMNQFWQHKNHIVIFEALKKYYERNPESDYVFVFTGKMEDYRNPNYINSLKKLMAMPELIQHVILLGFIDRKEQITIMKNAEYVIQPSLFEGWGTVVEDAKVLDKTIVLSDIPVHREQKNEKCILFSPHNAIELASIIEEEQYKSHCLDIEKGISDMYLRAKDYSIGFEKILYGE